MERVSDGLKNERLDRWIDAVVPYYHKVFVMTVK